MIEKSAKSVSFSAEKSVPSVAHVYLLAGNVQGTLNDGSLWMEMRQHQPSFG
jgi:hypothetical protein